MSRQKSSARQRCTILILIWKGMFASIFSEKIGNLSSALILLFTAYIIFSRSQITRIPSTTMQLRC
nr:hypothetical protein Iba_scaffold38198CG0010 [Ipomoea batatas]GMD00897.1 hypothetical protein Iba_chr05fCG2270 [Ipomoea batatas]